jgi:hypothetical protein
LELNPGEHLIAVVDAVGNRVEKRIVLRIGEHNRTVPITLPGPPKEPKPEVKYAPAKPPPVQVTWTPGPAPAPRSKGMGPWPWVFWSVGAVGLGVFAYEGLQGRAEYNRLKEQCGNACDPRLGDPIRTKFLVADISLGVGLLSTGIGTLVALTTKRSLPSVGVHVQPDALVTTYGGAF